MRSLITKVNKSRSPASVKILKSKVKKASKTQRTNRSVSVRLAAKRSSTKAKTKSAGRAVAKKKPEVRKAVAVKRKGKGPSRGKAPVRAVSARPVRKKAAAKASVIRRRRMAPRIILKPAPMPPKKSPTPATLAAVRAFELALKVFNRQDYSAARSAFMALVEKFADQAEIIARTRTYLAICDQRLARVPSTPRSVDGLYNQGVFELNRGKVAEAIELFERALKSEPRADHIMYSLAAAYSHLNNVPKALGSLTRAIALRPVHRSHARSDLDFVNLRGTEEFQQLTGYGFDLMEET